MEGEGHASSGGGAGKLLMATAFITTPMLLTTALLLTVEVKPVPLETEVTKAAGAADAARVKWLEERLKSTQAEADMNQRKARALEARLNQTGSPSEDKFDSFPSQHALAIAAAVVGVLSIAGPSTFVRFFLALVGSALGGLLVGGFAAFVITGSPFWLDSLGSLVNGSGGAVSYVLWGVLFTLGMLRWWSGWECAIYAYADEVELDENGNIILFERPLVSQEPAAK